MQSISVFLDTTKFSGSQWKNADVSRNQRVCHVIFTFFGSSLVRYNCAKLHNYSICETNLWEGGAFCPLFAPHPWAAPKRPILNRVNILNKYFSWKHQDILSMINYFLMLCKNKKSYDINGKLCWKKLISFFGNTNDKKRIERGYSKNPGMQTDRRINNRYMQRRRCVTQTCIFCFSLLLALSL